MTSIDLTNAAADQPLPAVAPRSPVTIIYDGDCPFCSAYSEMVRIRALHGEVVLVNARESTEHRERVHAAGLDLDDGFVVEHGGTMLHGAEALAFLSMPQGRTDLWSRLNGLLFAGRRRARVAYPVLRAGRNAALALLGRRRLR